MRRILPVVLAACAAADDPLPTRQVTVAIATDRPVATVSERFVSFAVDTAQVVVRARTTG